MGLSFLSYNIVAAEHDVIHFTIGLRSVCSGLQFYLGVSQERNDTFLLYIGEALSVDAWGTAVFLRTLVRFVEGCHLGDVGE